MIFQVLTDVDGWVLIDRSGKHFGTILNFLRDGYVPLPECRVETVEILAEAKYYLIQVSLYHRLKFIAQRISAIHAFLFTYYLIIGFSTAVPKLVESNNKGRCRTSRYLQSSTR